MDTAGGDAGLPPHTTGEADAPSPAPSRLASPGPARGPLPGDAPSPAPGPTAPNATDGAAAAAPAPGAAASLPRPRVQLLYNPQLSEFVLGEGHPMQPHRLALVHKLLGHAGLLTDPCLEVVTDYPPAPLEQLLRFHTREYLSVLQVGRVMQWPRSQGQPGASPKACPPLLCGHTGPREKGGRQLLQPQCKAVGGWIVVRLSLHDWPGPVVVRRPGE